MFRLFVPFWVLLFFVLGVIEINAQNTISEAFNNSQAVFSAKVEKVLNRDEISPRLRNWLGSSNYERKFAPQITIQKIYKRADALAITEGDKITIFPNNCLKKIAVGEEWIFFAKYDDYSLSWMISDCGQTKKTSEIGDDFKFVRQKKIRTDKPRIFGFVYQMVSRETPNQKAVYKTLPNVEVNITLINHRKQPEEKKEFKVKTDENGLYELVDFPEGMIYVYPATKFENQRMESVEKGDRGFYDNKKNLLFESDFYISLPDSFVKGKVLDENGKPVLNATVRLISTFDDTPYFTKAKTNELGEYQIQIEGKYNIEKYYVAADNGENYQTPFFPYQKTYFPGETEQNKAKVIEVKSGQTIENIDIKLGKPLVDKTVSGKVIFNNGEIVPAARVTFDGMQLQYVENHTDYLVRFVYPPNAEIQDGKFRLTSLEKSSGFLRAELFYKRDVLEKCLNRKLDLPDGVEVVFVRSKPFFLTLNSDLKDVTLRFAIPPCLPTAEPPKPQTGTYFKNQAKEFPQYGKLIAYPDWRTYEKSLGNADYYDATSPNIRFNNSITVFDGKIEKIIEKDEPEFQKIQEIFNQNYSNFAVVKINKLYKPAEIYGLEVGDSVLAICEQSKKIKVGDSDVFALNFTNQFERGQDLGIFWSYFDSVPSDRNRAYTEFLENPAKRTARKISGYVFYGRRNYNLPKDSKEDYEMINEPLADEPITLQMLNGEPIQGKNFLQTKTNADGYYKFEDLPAGEYRIRQGNGRYVSQSIGHSFGNIKLEEKQKGAIINLIKQDQVGVDFLVRYNAEITGKVLDEKGNPVPWVSVRLLDLDTKKEIKEHYYTWGTDPNGDYYVWSMPKGRYLLAVVRQPWEVTYENDFVTTYFPNATEVNKAQIIEIGDPPMNQVRNIVVSKRMGTKTVSGKIEFQNKGSVPKEIYVEYEGAIYLKKMTREGNDKDFWYYRSRQRTKVVNGKFSFDVPENTSGKIKAVTFITAEKAAKCLENQGYPEKDKEAMIQIYSTDVEVSAKQNINNLRVKFLAPSSCFGK